MSISKNNTDIKEVIKTDSLFSEQEEEVMASSVLNTCITQDFYKKPYLEASLEDYCQSGEVSFGPLSDYTNADAKLFIDNIIKKLSTLEEEQRLALLFDLKFYFNKYDKEDDSCFSRIRSYMPALIKDFLVVRISTSEFTNFGLYYQIKNNKLIINESDSMSMYYLADLIDFGEVMEILNNHNIEYLHMCNTHAYRMMEMWENNRW